MRKGQKHTKESIKKIKKARAKQIITRKTCKKISKANKKVEHTKEWNEKVGKSLIGHQVLEITRKKIRKKNKGKHHSFETEFKKGHKHSDKWLPAMKKMRGKNSSHWKNGANPINSTLRKRIEYKIWRKKVWERDNFICQKCKEKKGKLHSHHIKNFAQYPELRFVIDNGITFCEKCHKNFHKIYGKKNNTKEQLEEFLNNDK